MRRLFLLPLVITPLLHAQFGFTVYSPHIADGGGWKTVFTIVNLADIQGDGTLRFHAEDGSLLSLPVVTSRSPAAQVVSQLPVSLAANSLLVVETTGTAGTTTVGWAELNDQSVPTVLTLSTVFRYRVTQNLDYEASVLALPVAAKSIAFSFDNSGGFATGVAAMNASSVSSGTIAVTIHTESGQLLQTDTLTLASGAHLSFSLTQRYPATVGQRGTIRLTPDSLIWLGALALRFNPTGPFTTLPQLVR